MNPLLLLALVAGGAGLVYRLFIWQKPPAYPDPAALIQHPVTDAVVQRVNEQVVEIRLASAESGQLFSGETPETISQESAILEFHHAETLSFTAPPGHHYFALHFADGRRLKTAERSLAVAGTINLRDIGGYRTKDGRYVRWGQVFRSGALTGMMQPNTHLDHLSLKLVCDLRLDEEVAEVPDRLPENPRPRYVRLPINTEMDSHERINAILFNRNRLDQIMIKGYTEVMIDNNARRFGEILRLLTDENNLPALIHCTAGKDRTGVSIALLLLLLGVPDDVVIADYTLSNRFYEHYKRIAEKAIAPLKWMRITGDDLYPLLVSRAETMQATIAHIRAQYGSVDHYLTEKAGLTSEEIVRLRQNLLE